MIDISLPPEELTTYATVKKIDVSILQSGVAESLGALQGLFSLTASYI